MIKKDLYEVRIEATRPHCNFAVHAYFDRVPTAEEFLVVSLDELEANEEWRPGITDAVMEIFARGMPVPHPDLQPDVSSMFEYPDGWIRITRTRRYILD